LIILIMFGKEYKLWSFSLCSYSLRMRMYNWNLQNYSLYAWRKVFSSEMWFNQNIVAEFIPCGSYVCFGMSSFVDSPGESDIGE
jgi:hypothetical protein